MAMNIRNVKKRETDHWNSIKCLTCASMVLYVATSGSSLQICRYSRDIRMGSGMTFAKRLLILSLATTVYEMEYTAAYQGLPSKVSPTMIPSASVSSLFFCISSHVRTLPFVMTGTPSVLFRACTTSKSAAPCRRRLADT